jgi:hypothetical protein
LSSSDRITEILKRYSDLAKEETAELFYKPPVTQRNLFICAHCGKVKEFGVAKFFFHRLDNSTLLFCCQSCFSRWLKKNHTIRWTLNHKIYKFQQHPIEIAPDPNALSPEQKYQQYLAKCRLKENEKYKNLSETQKTQRRAKARERYRRNHPEMDFAGKRDPKGRFIKK